MKYINKLRKFITFAIVLSLIISLNACSVTSKDNGKLNVVTTLFPQYDFAKQIVGDKGTVELLLSPGIEAHSYDPTPADIIKINECDLFIYTGENMEVWAADIIESLENEVNVLNVSKGIELIKSEDEENNQDTEKHQEDAYEDIENHENTDEHKDRESENKKDEDNHKGHNHIYDPHIWTSPVIAGQMLNNILEEIVKEDPENEAYYRENADKYLKELDELDSQFRTLSDEADIKTIYFADKFAMYYFVEEYGFSYASAYDSCSAETEPSAKLVAKMVDEVKENQVKAIYYAELSNHKAADTISKETKADKLLLHSCHNVSKDEFNKGVTYVSLMKQNLENLKVGLCK